jgi:hypothetical protein
MELTLNEQPNTALDDLFLAIAMRHFPSVETLNTRHSDELDFHDVAIGAIRDAIAAAYAAGRRDAERNDATAGRDRDDD